MIIVNLATFPGTPEEAKEASRAWFGHARPHKHEYGIVLVDKETGNGYELHAFEAPCALTDDVANIRAVIAALREAADDLEAGHADMLNPEPAAAQDDVPLPVLVDLLGLVQVTVDLNEVAAWSAEQRHQAAHWASSAHMAASDNDDVAVPDIPGFVAQGDFRMGDLVRNKKTNAVMPVTGGGVWLESFYELVTPRPNTGVCDQHGAWTGSTEGCPSCLGQEG